MFKALVGVDTWLTVVTDASWLFREWWLRNCIGGVIGVNRDWFPKSPEEDAAAAFAAAITADFLTQIVFSFCHTKTLWTIAAPQNTIPSPIKTLVMIAGVEWNWVKVYKIIPEKGRRD